MIFDKRHTMTRLAMITLAGVFSAVSVGCESSAGNGSLIGAGLGALAGQAIGGDTTGTLIGTAVGGAVGYGIGNEADKDRARRDDRRYDDDRYRRDDDRYDDDRYRRDDDRDRDRGRRDDDRYQSRDRYEPSHRIVEYRRYYYDSRPYRYRYYSRGCRWW